MAVLGVDVTRIEELLKDVRSSGEQIVRKMISLLDRGGIASLDCGHLLGGEFAGKFNLVQLESGMFVIVCDECREFALMGENIIGEPRVRFCGTA